MNKYIRFGQIPKSGKSVNFIKLTFEQSEDFNYFLENFGYEKAETVVPPDCFEPGLSVFKMGKDGLPVLETLDQVQSLLIRLNDPAFEVSGNEVGMGQDGEPLLDSVQIVKRRRFSQEKMIDHVLRVMISNFGHCEKIPDEAGKDLSLHSFCRDEKVNIVTGEKKASYLCPFDSAEWVQLQPFTEWTFCGWTFADPLNGFCG